MFKRFVLLFFATPLLLLGLAWSGPNEDLIRGINLGKLDLVEQAALQGANPNQMVRETNHVYDFPWLGQRVGVI